MSDWPRVRLPSAGKSRKQADEWERFARSGAGPYTGARGRATGRPILHRTGRGSSMAEAEGLSGLFARLQRGPLAVLFLVFAIAWTPGFFTLPPLDRDEARFA